MDVKKLCNLVSSLWEERYDSAGNPIFDFEKHSLFIDSAKRCVAPDPTKIRIKNDFNRRFHDGFIQHRLLAPTESSKAKMKIKLARLQKERRLSLSHSLDPKLDFERDTKAVQNILSKAKKIAIPVGRSDHSIASDTGLGTAELVTSIFKKPPIDRTPKEIKQVFAILRKIPAFSKLSDFILNQLCGIISFIDIPSDMVVFTQGVCV